MRSSYSKSPRALSFLTIICAFPCFKVSATCFYPNGTADDTNRFQPCKSGGQSMCCATNTAVMDVGSIDTCDPNGFCIPSDNNGVWRALCTDQSWQDPACINLCTTGRSADIANVSNVDAFVPITTCGDRSLCCGSIDHQVGKTCCTQRKGLFLQDGKIVSTTTSSSLSTSAPTSSSPSAQSSSSTLAPTSSSTLAQSSKSTSSTAPTPKLASNNTGAIVGGVVGGVAGVVVAGLAFWYFMIRRNLRQRSQPKESYGLYQTGKGQIWQDPKEAPTYGNGAARGELDAAQPRTQELEGWQGHTS